MFEAADGADWGGLGAAAALLATYGYGDVRAHELAHATRRSVGSLYRAYGSKAGVARAVRRAAERDLAWRGTSAWRVSDTASGDFRTPFLAVWDALAAWAGEHPALFAYAYLHPALEAPEDSSRPPEETQARQLVLEVLETGRTRGAVRPSPAWLLAGVVWGALAELVRASQARGRRLSNAEIAEAGEAVWCALRSPAAVGARGGATGGARRSIHPLHARLAERAEVPAVGSLDAAPEAHAFAEGGAEAPASARETAAGAPPRVASHRAHPPDLGAGPVEDALVAVRHEPDTGEWTDALAAASSAIGARRSKDVVAPAGPALEASPSMRTPALDGPAREAGPGMRTLASVPPAPEAGPPNRSPASAGPERAASPSTDSATGATPAPGNRRIGVMPAPDANLLEDYLACVAPVPEPGGEEAPALDDALASPDAPPPPLRTVEDMLRRWPRGTEAERWCAQTAMDRGELGIELYLAWRTALHASWALEAQGPPPPELQSFQDMWDQPAWDEDPPWDVDPAKKPGGA